MARMVLAVLINLVVLIFLDFLIVLTVLILLNNLLKVMKRSVNYFSSFKKSLLTFFNILFSFFVLGFDGLASLLRSSISFANFSHSRFIISIHMKPFLIQGKQRPSKPWKPYKSQEINSVVSKTLEKSGNFFNISWESGNSSMKSCFLDFHEVIPFRFPWSHAFESMWTEKIFFQEIYGISEKLQMILLFVFTNCSVIYSNCKQLDTDILYYDEISCRVEKVWLHYVLEIIRVIKNWLKRQQHIYSWTAFSWHLW